MNARADTSASGTPGARWRIGLDVGGTFTDLYMVDTVTGAVHHHKLPSTPAQPELAPLQGIGELLSAAGASGAEVAFVGLGTTVATNALLERKGARTGLITTAGFRDLLEIARQKRPHTFDLHAFKPAPLVTRELRREAIERIGAGGEVLVPLDLEALAVEVDGLRAAGVHSVAICFINAFANPVHERAAADFIRARWPQAEVTASSDVLPEFREYERLSTTLVNAFLMPVMRGYLTRFEAAVAKLGIPQPPFTMGSSGGVMTAADAAQRPIDTLFSGPSGGVSGAVHVARRAGFPNIITFDMGGTSTDVCLIADSTPQLSYYREIDGLPLRAAALDVHTVGAGGGSIAGVDAGGLLRVGPHSAGSRPGPACYGHGGEQPTVTDANVVLGRLHPRWLLGGKLPIDAGRARATIQAKVAGPRGLSVEEAAAAIIAIADANMAHAVRHVSVERGFDPQDFSLVAFGGAGPLHAASVASQLGIGSVLIPPAPGVLCAMGVLAKDVQMDLSRTRLVIEGRDDLCAEAESVYGELEQQARAGYARNGYDTAAVTLVRTVDMRYLGQNHELAIAVPQGRCDTAWLAVVKDRFHAAHEQLYGYCSRDKAVELVTFRLCARFALPPLADAAVVAGEGGTAQPAAMRPVWFERSGGFVDAPVYERRSLSVGDRLTGPLIVEQMDATTVVPPGFSLTVDAVGNLILRELPESAS